MSVDKFKFVSPGVFINEIDQSKLPRLPEDIGPVVIGRALRGPMMRPVKVNSLLEFEQLFGQPVAGASNVDFHREGNQLAPTYGAFAAEAYLKNSGPLTFVRLGGFQSPSASPSGEAGWKTSVASGSTAATNGGALALFIAPVSGSSVSGSAKLAAVIYCDGATIGLSGQDMSGASVTNKSGVWIKATEDSSKTFKIAITTDPTTTTTKTVNFVDNSKEFIRTVLNTNPTKTNSFVTSGAGEKYWLAQTFENAIGSTTGAVAGIIVALRGEGLYEGGSFKKVAQKSSTGWIFGQHKGVPTAFVADPSTGKYPVQNLFKFHTLSEDPWVQNNIKISIQDIKVPTSEFTKFGTFSVVVRQMNDTDDQPMIIERFDGCTLDPASANYIAKKIGDISTDWDDNIDRYVEYGTYQNLSRYIRVEVDPDVASGVADQDLLPFGFYGPKVYKSVTVSGSANTPVVITGSTSFFSTDFFNASSSTGIVSATSFTASLQMPVIPTVTTSNGYYVAKPANIYWGVKSTIGATKKFNKEIGEYLLTLPDEFGDNDDTSVKTQYSFVFSLDDISGSATNNVYSVGAWAEGNRSGSLSVTSGISGNAVTGSTSLAGFLQTFNKFTLPLLDGFDGLNIKDKEPFNNPVALVDGSTETSSSPYYSVIRAINSVADPEVLDMNALVVPGIKNTSVHQKMVATCETRGDSIAIVDIQGDYDSAFESTAPESSRKPDVQEAADYVKSTLSLNSSYGCAFFPWVMITDPNSGNKIWVPPSVPAIGTFGSTKRFSEVWFAPAGFTRGGLSSNNAGGLPVVQVSRKLTSKERDILYTANINPIASFPSEGIVVFGQKTLQSTPSALDRINVRRLMNYVKKEISRIASTILFDPNVQATWNVFLGEVRPFLQDVQARLGITEFKVVLDETTTTPELIDRNILYAKIFIKPARAIEFIALDFVITNTGASFND